MNDKVVKEKIDECKIKANELSNRMTNINNVAIDYLINVDKNPDGSIPISEPFRKDMLSYLDEQKENLNSIGNTLDELLITYDRDHPVNVAKRKKEHEQELAELVDISNKITELQYNIWLNKKFVWYKKLFKKIKVTKISTNDERLNANIYYRINDNEEQKFIAERWELNDMLKL